MSMTFHQAQSPRRSSPTDLRIGQNDAHAHSVANAADENGFNNVSSVIEQPSMKHVRHFMFCFNEVSRKWWLSPNFSINSARAKFKAKHTLKKTNNKEAFKAALEDYITDSWLDTRHHKRCSSLTTLVWTTRAIWNSHPAFSTAVLLLGDFCVIWGVQFNFISNKKMIILTIIVNQILSRQQ